VKVIASTLQNPVTTMPDKSGGSVLLRNYLYFSAAFGTDRSFWIFLTVDKSTKHAADFVGNNIPGATDILKENINGIIRLRVS